MIFGPKKVLTMESIFQLQTVLIEPCIIIYIAMTLDIGGHHQLKI